MITKGYQCNYLTVIGDKAERVGDSKSYSYLCKCKCGNIRYVKDNVLRYNHIQDCGCRLYQLDKAKEEYIGKKYNLLTIVDCFRKEYQGKNRIFGKCKCDCGNDYELTITEIIRGDSKSCGCLRNFDFDRDYKGKVFHGIKVLDLIEVGKHPTDSVVLCECHCGNKFNTRLIYLIKKTRYIIACPKCNGKETPMCNIRQIEEQKDGDIKSILYGMKDRCRNPNRPDAKWYFHKHIKICDEWLSNSSSFVEWAKNNGYKKGLTIDRIDPNGDYCPDNCRWVDMETQNNNQTNSKKYLFQGEMLSIAQISRKVNINYRTLLGRINRGMSPDEAFSKPVIK